MNTKTTVKKPDFKAQASVIPDGKLKRRYINRLNYFWKLVKHSITQEETNYLILTSIPFAHECAIREKGISEMNRLSFEEEFAPGGCRSIALDAQHKAYCILDHEIIPFMVEVLRKYTPQGTVRTFCRRHMDMFDLTNNFHNTYF